MTVSASLTEPPVAETEEVVIDHQDWGEDVAMSDNAPVQDVTGATTTLQSEPTAERVHADLQPRDGPLTDLQV